MKDLLDKLKLAGCRCDSFESQSAVIAILEAAIAEEREACAKLCDPPDILWASEWGKGAAEGRKMCSEAIRSRGKP